VSLSPDNPKYDTQIHAFLRYAKKREDKGLSVSSESRAQKSLSLDLPEHLGPRRLCYGCSHREDETGKCKLESVHCASSRNKPYYLSKETVLAAGPYPRL